MKCELRDGGAVEVDVRDEGGDISGRRPVIVLTAYAPAGGAQVRLPLDEGNAEALMHGLQGCVLQVQTRAAGR